MPPCLANFLLVCFCILRFALSKEPQLQVDFHTGMDADSDIAFHFQVCFGHCVAMNSHECGVWECEVKSDNVPFEDGKSFDLHVSVLDNEYWVMVSSQHCYSFARRLLPGSVKMVQVWRGVSLISTCV
uniref:Galectin n=1 Tax=Piliocolobus tephrosceles TaxID=591936 RepID=A0A8C9IYR0_9PRIM